jgi:hypothetical protein
MNGISQLFCAGCGGFNVEFLFPPCFFYQIFHYKFSHGTPADIPVTDKQNPDHNINSIRKKGDHSEDDPPG